jgi:hypothetical protein
MTPERLRELFEVSKQTTDRVAGEGIVELIQAVTHEHNEHAADHNALREAMARLDEVALERNRMASEVDRLLGLMGTIYLVSSHCGPQRHEPPTVLHLVPEGGWS